jgi:hypothetical protein
MPPAKKAAAKKAAATPEDDTPDVSDVRITTKYDSTVDEDRKDGLTMRQYTFSDGTTAKAWKVDSEDGWNVAVSDAQGRFLSTKTGSELTVEQANVMIEQAGQRADENTAKRAALSD